jgi:hypothetical protein
MGGIPTNRCNERGGNTTLVQTRNKRMAAIPSFGSHVSATIQEAWAAEPVVTNGWL